jgi:hypothetical protein
MPKPCTRFWIRRLLSAIILPSLDQKNRKSWKPQAKGFNHLEIPQMKDITLHHAQSQKLASRIRWFGGLACSSFLAFKEPFFNGWGELRKGRYVWRKLLGSSWWSWWLSAEAWLLTWVVSHQPLACGVILVNTLERQDFFLWPYFLKKENNLKFNWSNWEPKPWSKCSFEFSMPNACCWSAVK